MHAISGATRYKVLMGTLLHGAQLVSQPVLVGLVSGPYIQTQLFFCHHEALHQTIIKSRLLHRGSGVCLSSSHELPVLPSVQLQCKHELVRVLAQPLIVLQKVTVPRGVACHQCLQVVLGSLCTILADGLAWLDATPSLATSGANNT